MLEATRRTRNRSHEYSVGCVSGESPAQSLGRRNPRLPRMDAQRVQPFLLCFHGVNRLLCSSGTCNVEMFPIAQP